MAFDLDNCRNEKLPIEDDSVSEFYMSHCIEHIKDTLALMQDLHRVAIPGAKITIRTPYGSSDDAWEDPTHVRAYFLQSWLYFAQPAYWRADYGYRGDWQAELVVLSVDKYDPRIAEFQPEDILRKVYVERNLVKEMTAVLRAIKPIREAKKELQRPPRVHFSFGGST